MSHDAGQITPELHDRVRTLILVLVCLGMLMIVLDTTIVTVALPSIVTDLRLSGAAVTWLLNAYTLSFGGCLLVGGRLSDLHGPRRLFLSGIGLFTLASLTCGLAATPTMLLLSRAAQGVGAAVIEAVSLALIATIYPDPAGRARALGLYGLICAAGGGIGVALGGLLTHALNWHWIFWVNLPVGLTIWGFCWVFLPRGAHINGSRRLDIAGAVTVTSALTLAAYALVDSNPAGWASSHTGALLGCAMLLLLLFVLIERHVSHPLVPLRLFRLRTFATTNYVGVLWTAGTLAWFVIAALYLQRVLGYDPLRAGMAFVPAELLIGAFSAGLSKRVIMQFGYRRPLYAGLLLVAGGLALFARAPLDGSFLRDVLPGMLLLGAGVGIASSPLLLAAMSEIDRAETGVASGVINTSMMLGGALGLAILSSAAQMRTDALRHSGIEALAALNSGYHFAFALGAGLTVLAAALSAFGLRGASLVETPEPVIARNG